MDAKVKARIIEIEIIFDEMSKAEEKERESFLKLCAESLREEYFMLIRL